MSKIGSPQPDGVRARPSRALAGAPHRTPLPLPPHEAARSEVEHHIEELVDRLREQGWKDEEARAEALRRFGSPRAYAERLERTERKRSRRMSYVELWTLVQAVLVQTLRTLRRQPGYAAGVILTLGLGVGANAAMFAILDRLLFQPPMHVVEHEHVKRVVVERSFIGRLSRSTTIAFPDFEDLKKHDGFSQVAAYVGTGESTLGSGPEATRVGTAQATWELFPLLGVRPLLGRFYGPEEDQVEAPRTTVISEEYWKRAFARAPDVLGRALDVGGQNYTVIGVAPAGFTGVGLAPVDLWLPLRAANTGYSGLESRNAYWMSAVARLEGGADLSAAMEEATALHRGGREASIAAGNYDAEARIALDPLIQARGPEASPESRVARWLGGVSLLVLVIACANVANLLLARGTRRRREISVRLALGAERSRAVGLLAGEAVLLALIGGVFALAVATWGGGALRRMLLPGVHFAGTGPSGRLVLFTAVAALVAGLAAALGPALHATRRDLARDLTGSVGSSGRRSRTRALLTAGQAALAAVLLAGAGLFVKSVAEVRRLDLGLDVDRLALVTLEIEPTVTDTNELYERAMAWLRPLPGVEAVAGTRSPFQWAFATDMQVEGWDSIPRLEGGGPYYHQVTDGYLATVGLRLLEGRWLTADDRAGGERVTVVSQTMAEALWPDGSALGRCLFVGGDNRGRSSDVRARGECTRIVGVVEDASRGSIQEPAHMAYYLPIAQHAPATLRGLYVRTAGNPARLAEALAAPLRSLDPAVRYVTVSPLRGFLAFQTRSWTLGATMFSIFGVLALVVAAIGLYSALAFDVAQSTREIGIRTALGAERARLLAAVLLRGLGMAALGVAAGVLVTLAAAPYAADLLFRVSPRDPAVLALAAGSLLVVAVAASLLPGLRATRVDAMEALRTD